MIQGINVRIWDILHCLLDAILRSLIDVSTCNLLQWWTHFVCFANQQPKAEIINSSILKRNICFILIQWSVPRKPLQIVQLWWAHRGSFDVSNFMAAFNASFIAALMAMSMSAGLREIVCECIGNRCFDNVSLHTFQKLTTFCKYDIINCFTRLILK